MKAQTLVRTTLLTVMLTSTLGATAAPKADKERALPNGRPFQQLQNQIDENAAATAGLADAIADIEANVSALTARVVEIEGEIDDLDVRVAENHDEITALLADTESLAAMVTANASTVQALADEHDADIAAINDRIAAAEADLLALSAAVGAAVADLNTQLAALSATAGANADAVIQLLSDVALLQGQVTTLTAALASDQTAIAALRTDLDALAIQLASLYAELDNRVATLEGLHSDALVPGNTAAVVSREGINDTGVIDFRCAEWDGDVCTRPQTRVPSSTCSTYSEADVWHDIPFTNDPLRRICPSFCQGATGNPAFRSCASTGNPTPNTPQGRVSAGWAASQTGCLSSGDYRWVADIDHPSGSSFYTTRFSTTYSNQQQLQIECEW